MNGKTRIGLFVFFGTCLLLAGCAATGKKATQETGEQAQAPIVSSPVQILWDRPVVPFMILGRVQASAPVNTADELLYQALQREGEKLFANAVVVQQGGIQAIRDGNDVKKQANGWAISYTLHAPIHQDPTAGRTPEQEEEDEQNMPSGFGLLP